jgi:hypothetical protein
MRGPTRIGLLAISLVCMFAFVAASASAAERQLFNEENKTTRKLLRDVNTKPPTGALQPDALEFVNNGTAKLAIAGLGTIECSEIEFGTTLVNNDGVNALKLAIPFGVAEGDNCTLAGVGNVPTYFDTLANGAVGSGTNVASVTVTGANPGPYTAVVHDLKFSQNIGGKFCTAEVNLAQGKVANSKGLFVEEKTPNLEAKFEKVKLAVSGEAGCPTEAELTANFFLETPSTTTDTAWIE